MNGVISILVNTVGVRFWDSTLNFYIRAYFFHLNLILTNNYKALSQ